MDDCASFGAWIRRRRKALDLTQAELAQQVGCALGTIRHIEQDERRPSKQLAALLADALGIPAAQRTAFLYVAGAEVGVDHLVIPPPMTSTPPNRPRLPEQAAAQPISAARWPMGTVTFLFTDIETANQHYWGGRPKLDGIEYLYLQESAVALTAYTAGQLDITALDPSQLPAIKSDPILSKELAIYPAAGSRIIRIHRTG